jgi:hypothetical protein
MTKSRFEIPQCRLWKLVWELGRDEQRGVTEPTRLTFRGILLLLWPLLIQVRQHTASLRTMRRLLSSDMINVLFDRGLNRSGASVLQRVVHGDRKHSLARRSGSIVFALSRSEDDVESQEIRNGLDKGK